MNTQERQTIDKEISILLKGIKENPYKTFNLAFLFTGVIPLILMAVVTFTLISEYSLWYRAIIFVAMVSLIAGYYIGYSILRRTLAKVIAYSLISKRREQIKTSMVASMSHELGNPITSIKLALSNVLEGFLGRLTKDQRKVLESCYEITDRIGRMTASLLDVFKVEAGVISVKRTLCDVVEILKYQVEELSEQIKSKEMNLEIKLPNKEVCIWADRDCVARIFNNLISNAVKYTPEKGTIAIRVFTKDEMAVIEVEDNGTGIKADKLDYIFDKYARLDNTQEGTGLGLAIAKEIVDLHKGKIVVTSEWGKGSKFTVYLPIDLRGPRKDPQKQGE